MLKVRIAQDCARCGGGGGMILVDEWLKAARGCVYCGAWDWGDGIALGNKDDALADADELASLIRGWAMASGLDWRDKSVRIEDGGEGMTVSVEGEPEFAERWRKVFDLAADDYIGW